MKLLARLIEPDAGLKRIALEYSIFTSSNGGQGEVLCDKEDKVRRARFINYGEHGQAVKEILYLSERTYIERKSTFVFELPVYQNTHPRVSEIISDTLFVCDGELSWAENVADLENVGSDIKKIAGFYSNTDVCQE